MKKNDFVAASTKGGLVVATAVVFGYIVGLVTQVTLARILEPEVFGRFAVAATVAMFVNACATWHGDKYVVHQNKSPERAVDAVFTLELCVATVLLVLVLLLAPSTMRLLGKSDLTPYVQVLAFAFLYNPLIRPRCLFERNLAFIRSKLPFLLSQSFAAVLAISLALNGFGIWSLIAWRLSVLIAEVMIIWVIAPYRPRLVWKPALASNMLAYTWPLTLSGILVFFYYNVDYLIVGQVLSDGEKQLGYYWLGFQSGSYFLMCRQVLGDVLFPIFSRLDDEEFKSRAFQRISQATAGVFLVPSLLIIYFGRDLVVMVYGSKWEPAVFPFQVIFITVLTRVISANMGYYLWSRGQTRPQLAMAASFSLLLPPSAYWATVHYGINGTAVAVLLVQIVVIVFAYERYIKPATGCGTSQFFFWPWALSGITLLLAHQADSMGMTWPARSLTFAAILVIAYFAMLRSVIRDVVRGLRSTPPPRNAAE